MKIGIYDPYFHILGGAERYVLAIASCFKKTDEIVLFGTEDEKIREAEVKFGQKTNAFIAKPWPKSRSSRLKKLSGLDTFVYVTDGSLFFSPAKKNILLIQSPVHIPVKTLTNRIKLFSWHSIICYSQFMAAQIKQKLHRDAQILFVPLNGQISEVSQKENYILSVGRFFPHLHNKKQLEMVHFFKELINEGLTGTRLYLIGSVDPGGESYLAEVKKAAAGLPIEIKTNISYDQLQALYKGAKVYWHAAGFGEDLKVHPEKAEHFGVVTLEAMAQGAVPVVFKAGGQPELINDNQDGFVWETKEALKTITRNLMTDENLRATISKRAQEKK